MRTITLTLLLAITLLVTPAMADDHREPITLARIMADADWMGTPPRDAYWAEEGDAIYYTRKRVGERVDDLYRLPLDGGEASVVEVSDLAGHTAADGDYNADRTLKAFVRQGDLYLQDLDNGGIRQLTRTAAGYSDPRFLLDGRIAVRAGNSVHAYDPQTGLLERIAEISFNADPTAREPASGYLAEQQRRLLGVVAERIQRDIDERVREAADTDLDEGRPSRPFHLGENRRLVDADLAPNGRWLLVATADSPRNGPRQDTVPFFVSEDGYVDNRNVRPKVGEGEPGPHRFQILDTRSGTVIDVDLSGLPGIATDPLRRMREAQDLPALEGERALQWMGAAWSDDAARVALMVRSVDNKDRWIAVIDTADFSVTTRHHLSDEAWINWYTARDFFWFNDFGWLPDNETLWYQSEESGYSHLYLRGPRDRRARALTRGEFEVSHPQLSHDGAYFYYSANAEHPGIHEVYRVSIADRAVERLTHLNARTGFVLSRDESMLLLTSSNPLRNDELFVQAIGDSEARQLTNSMSTEFLSYPWVMPETVAIPSSNVRGRSIYTRVYLPEDFDPEREEAYPVVMFAHGAGYLQNVHFGFSGYFREFMFHTFLVERGYIVIDMDYRASAGYGRDWRTAIYRDMGRPELQDFRDGIDWLVANRNADPERIGIYGGSYGGFLAFMGLFLEPDMFAAGAALRPVSDWAHYHHLYTSNILNTPELDPEAYERSSPIEYAEGLNRPLLILAPMVDTNVLFMDVVRLVQRLIELEKTEFFETAIYPVENHGFIEPSSWLDEYRRIYRLFDEHLN
jgi:dipeptidyl aminopeptidase/acylaminoacyl peptidase